MIGDLMNLLFRSGIPYDAQRNKFSVKPEDMPRIQNQMELMQEENRWMTRPMNDWMNND